jgi:hypothetical protein
MLIERLLPHVDATRVEHRLVSGDIETVFAATKEADFIRAWKDHGAVRLLFSLRGLGERLNCALRRRPFTEPPEPDRLRLADMPTRGDWVLLGEDPPVEIAFGVIGRFWGGETVWEQIDASDFAGFDRPGFGKVACNFSLRPYGPAHTLVSYEARTKATDAEAREGFLRYWRPLAPFIGVVMRAQLRVIEQEATNA